MNLPSPIVQLRSQFLADYQVELYVKRDDLIDPVISGNKWRKLRLNVEKFELGGYEKLLTFGGAYSNHISATARVGRELNIPTIGIIRGDELNEYSNATLKQASEDGMELIFTSREEYKLKEEKYYQEELRRRHGICWVVPEGGANFYGTLGCQEIVKEFQEEPDYVITACGTGTTAAGLISGAVNYKVIGVSVLKGGEFLNNLIFERLLEMGFSQEDLADRLTHFELVLDGHFGGYAQYTKELISFINHFYREFQIPLDHIYVGKMMYTLFQKIRANYFERGSKIVALHTGGIQGTKGLSDLFVFD